MGKKYELKLNPFNDYLMNLIIDYEIDITTKNNKVEIFNVFTVILSNFVDDEDYIRELNFDIVNDNDDHFRVLAYNEITALWLSGHMLADPKLANEDFYLLGEKKMCYDKKLLKLVPYEE